MKRLKYRESTLCDYTKSKQIIFEGDILCCGDNYPCVVLYNKFEATFDLVEFGNEDVRTHSMTSFTVPYTVIGNIDDNEDLLVDYPNNFDYTNYLSQYFC